MTLYAGADGEARRGHSPAGRWPSALGALAWAQETAGMGREDADKDGALTEEELENIGQMPIEDPDDDQDGDEGEDE
ncbi:MULTISPECIES: hypothetical protein [Streptomyces]|nr:hypothetical protein [Streptomyces ruber]